MKTTIALFALVSFLIRASGCTDIDAKTTPSFSHLNGTWELFGRTDAPENPPEGSACNYGQGTGTLTIGGTRVTGTATDNSEYC